MGLSKYIKSKIKGKSWKNKAYREHINNLKLLEAGIRGQGLGWTGNMAFGAFKSKYKEEYKAIMEELYPGRCKQEKKMLAKERKREQREAEEERKRGADEQRKEKELWLRLGGVT